MENHDFINIFFYLSCCTMHPTGQGIGNKKIEQKIALCNKLTGVIIISDNEEKIILLIRYMARDGMCEEDIAKKLKISKVRLSKILKENTGLKNEIEYSKQLTQFAVEDALLKKALGTTSVEVKETEKQSGTEKVKVTKEIPADTSALQFWLKNRCPDRWCDNANEHGETIEKLNQIMDNITLLAEESE